MPSPKKTAIKPTATPVAKKPVAKKPAPAKKPAAKAPVAAIKAPVVKKPVAKKAPATPVAKAPKPKLAIKAPAKTTAVKKPVAKVGLADGIKKTAVAAKPAVDIKAAVAKALPTGFEQRTLMTVATVTVLSAEPSDHNVLAQTAPLGADYTVNFFNGKGGVAMRQIHVTAEQKSLKRLSIEVTLVSVLKAVLGYENRRSSNKAFRGLTELSAVITRNGTATTAPLSVLLHLNPVQASGF